MDKVHFIYLSVDGYLHCVHALAVRSTAVLNIHVQVFAWTYVFIPLQFIPRRIAASSCDSMFIFLTNC